MKNLAQTLLLFSCLFLFTACGDSHDKLMKDQFSMMREMTSVFNGVADGSMSSADAVKKIEKLDKLGAEIYQRKLKLNKDASPEDLQKLGEKYQDEMQKVFKDYMSSLQKLSRSDRWTNELDKAMADFGNNDDF